MINKLNMFIMVFFSALLLITFNRYEALKKNDLLIMSNQAKIQKTLDERQPVFDAMKKRLEKNDNF